MSFFGWLIFASVILCILALDLFVFHKKTHLVTFKEACCWTFTWVFAALLFNLYVYLTRGSEAAVNFLTSYLIEKSLSVDNLFVFLTIFQYFQTPKMYWHKVLFWGILGAIVVRGIFIILGIGLIQIFHPVMYVFGAFLIYTGLKWIFQKGKTVHPERNPLIRFFYRFFPTTFEYDQDRFFILQNGKRLATPLFIVLLSIETADILFAADSIPAVLAITYDPFIIFTSNIFAIIGLRALFFILAGMLERFVHLHYGVSTILVFVGIKMVLSDWIKIPSLIALGVIVGILLISILSSLYQKKFNT